MRPVHCGRSACLYRYHGRERQDRAGWERSGTDRVPIPQFPKAQKFYLTKDETKRLLGARVTIEEKMDGANAGIVRHKKGFTLQKRGSLVGQSEHEQFGFFYNWANQQNYDKIMSVPVGHLLYGELMYAQHHIYYDQLPDYFLIFDIWNGKKFLNSKQRREFCWEYGFSQVPFIAENYFTIDDLYDIIPKESDFGDRAEGIVIKRYRKKEYMRGKIVWPEFIKELDESEHWTRRGLRINKLITHD